MTKQEIEKFIQVPGYMNDRLTPSKLQRGHIYLAKNGLIVLYLGISSMGSYIFYALSSCYIQTFHDESWKSHMRIMNHEWQIQGISQTIETTMAHKGDHLCIMIQKKIPNIIGEFPCKDYEDIYRTWYQDSFGDKIGSIDIPDIGAKTVGEAYVSAKDLEPGRLYYTGNGWGSIFVFLGRSTANKFIWYNIRCAEHYYEKSVSDILERSFYTSSNKKVKPLCRIVDDPDAFDVDVAKKIMEMRPHVDMTKIDQHMLDKAVGEEL